MHTPRLPPLKSREGRGILCFNKVILMINDPLAMAKELTQNLELRSVGIVSSSGSALELSFCKVLLLNQC